MRFGGGAAVPVETLISQYRQPKLLTIPPAAQAKRQRESKFPFRKLQISISQTTDSLFVSFHFVSQTTISLVYGPNESFIKKTNVAQ